jgi:hypothetical protein
VAARREKIFRLWRVSFLDRLKHQNDLSSNVIVSDVVVLQLPKFCESQTISQY